jgi:hypothetical protein
MVRRMFAMPGASNLGKGEPAQRDRSHAHQRVQKRSSTCSVLFAAFVLGRTWAIGLGQIWSG